jgi:hypothetical protein
MPPLAWIIPVVSGGRSIMHFVEVIVFLVRLPIQFSVAERPGGNQVETTNEMESDREQCSVFQQTERAAS